MKVIVVSYHFIIQLKIDCCYYSYIFIGKKDNLRNMDAVTMNITDASASESESSHPCQTPQEVEICPICHDELTSPTVTLDCGHVLDGKCFKEFLAFELRENKTSINCPLCRHQIMEVIRIEHTQQDESSNNDNENMSYRQVLSILRRSGVFRMLFCTVFEVCIVTGIVLAAYNSSCIRNHGC
jgi:DNA-directed RNA polymerase subunit RPC12/RpoP